jgi:hypothetical protein
LKKLLARSDRSPRNRPHRMRAEPRSNNDHL